LPKKAKKPGKREREMSQARILTGWGAVAYFLLEKQTNDMGKIYADTVINGKVTEQSFIAGYGL
jgi:hypothetical protein